MKKSLMILFAVILLMPAAASSQVLSGNFGLFAGPSYELEAAMLKWELGGQYTFFDRHIRVFGNGNWAEKVDDQSKEYGAEAEIIYVPNPVNHYDIYFALGADYDWQKDLLTTEEYLSYLVGLGIVFQFGWDLEHAVYFGYRSKNNAEAPDHKIELKLVYGF